MTRTAFPQPGGLDLTTCDREPIHTPGSIQPHGVLLVLDGATLAVRRVSRNVAGAFGTAPDGLIGKSADVLLGAEAGAPLRAAAGPGVEAGPHVLGVVRVGPADAPSRRLGLVHRSGDALVLELEDAPEEGVAPFKDLYQPLQSFLARVDRASGTGALEALAAEEVRRVTGFDRVLVYQFDDDGHGTVVAEDRNDRLPSLLGHRFPASDIPRQARELYRLNRLRLIPDAGYTPVPVVPAGGPPLDLTHSTLRSVAPVHVQYMKNMGTAASMSISVLREGRLWGLISCHHKTPRYVPYATRASCDLLSQVFAMQLANKVHRGEYEQRLRLTAVQSRLVASLTARDDFVDGLADHADDLLEFAGAAGVAILHDGRCTLLGETPGEADVRRVAAWLSGEVAREVFATDSLAAAAADAPWAEAVRERAAGVLAVSISKLHGNFLVWFRPELVRTVVWAGDPHKPAEPDAGGAADLGPRASFESWKETVRLRSEPWPDAVVEAAGELRNAIVGVVLKRAEELAQLNADLRRSNQELEAFSYSVSHDLRAPFRHIVGYSELLRETEGDRLGAAALRYVDTIIESARFAGTLVDNLLAFSRMGRTAIHPVHVDMNELARETVAEAGRDAAGRSVVWEVGDLPPAKGDLMMLRLAWTNLLSNAVKYTRNRAEAVIEVGGECRGGESVYHVRDNGIGFDMKYADKLFGVFQRLHRMEDFEGTGIGLANVRRIVSRHGGRAWAEGAVDRGATFYFSLPGGDDPGLGGRADDAQADPAG